MLYKEFHNFTPEDVEKGYNILKAENNQRLKPLQQLLSEGKEISEADERFMDSAGNLVDEYLLVQKVKEDGNVERISSTLDKMHLKMLELLINKSRQEKLIDITTSKKRM